MSVERVNFILSLLTVFGQISVVTLVILCIISWTKKANSFLLYFFSNNSLIFSWVVALIAMFGSLYYSEVAGYAPCILCWYQRIMMYPQAFILGLAYFQNDNHIRKYSIFLSSIGAIISAFHYFEQITSTPLIPCSTIGYSVSCTEKFFMNFGYITIPMMALTAFLMIIVFMLCNKIFESKNFSK